MILINFNTERGRERKNERERKKERRKERKEANKAVEKRTKKPIEYSNQANDGFFTNSLFLGGKEFSFFPQRGKNEKLERGKRREKVGKSDRSWLWIFSDSLTAFWFARQFFTAYSAYFNKNNSFKNSFKDNFCMLLKLRKLTRFYLRKKIFCQFPESLQTSYSALSIENLKCLQKTNRSEEDFIDSYFLIFYGGKTFHLHQWREPSKIEREKRERKRERRERKKRERYLKIQKLKWD